ncbi:MAG: hypothetical protein KDC83_09555 [Flavobacteriales bacterium]|nr:hypothetical protein [Flavobacteriales bacterium]
MKIYYLLILLATPILVFGQSSDIYIDNIESKISALDTVGSGKVEFVDSALNIKVVYPFKAKKVDGKVEGYYLDNNKLAFSGKSIKNLKQGLWEYYSYDSLGTPTTFQWFNYDNDSLSGPFMQIKANRLINGSYLNDSLDGAFKSQLISSDDSGNTILAVLDSGLYSKGKRYGEWVFFKNGKLFQIGYYENGLMHRNWKEFDLLDRDTNTLMVETQYFEGTKTGNEKIYFHYDFIPCPDTEDTNCIDTIKVMEFEQIPWQDGEMTGSYFKTDEKANTLEKGTYNKNKKMGEWVFTDPISKTEETINFLDDVRNGPYVLKVNSKTTITGTYAQGKKSGTWTYRDETGHKLRDENYDKGIRSGDWSYYQSQGALGLKKVFANDTMVELYEYNKDEVETMIFEFRYKTNSAVVIKYQELNKDSLVFKDFVFQPDSGGLNDETFMELFKTSGKDTSVFILDGGYVVKKDGQPDVMGTYSMNVMTGNWDYYYNPSILWRKVYDMGFMKFEMFLDKATLAPIDKGDYVLWYGAERPRLEIKVKEGLRNGKSTYYKVDGEVLKIEKYKDGVIQ